MSEEIKTNAATSELNSFNNLVNLMVQLEQLVKRYGFMLWTDPNGLKTFPIVSYNGITTPGRIMILLPEAYAKEFHPKSSHEPKQVQEFVELTGER